MSEYEDALNFANKALDLDESHNKSKFRKAKALAYLRNFDDSLSLLSELYNEISKAVMPINSEKIT
jgi:tetratricopeptide (TPR) repeat protein